MIPQLLASTRPAQSMLLDVGMLLPAALHPGVAYADAPSDQGEAPRQQGQNENHRDYIEQV